MDLSSWLAILHCEPQKFSLIPIFISDYNELISELNKIPVRTDTLKMKQRKIEIEKQLDKLEGGIRIFSRSKVYVKIDAWAKMPVK